MAIISTFSKMNGARKAAAAALVALTLGAGLVATAGEAEARNGRKGAAIAAGLIGALAVGALVAGASEARGGYYEPTHGGYYPPEPGYGYVPPQPDYYQPSGYYRSYEPTPYYGYERPRRRHAVQCNEGAPYGPCRNPYYAASGRVYAGPSCKIKTRTYFDGYDYHTERVRICR